MITAPELTYTRTVLHQTDFFEIVACEWIKNSVSPPHGHDWSQCYVLVQQGRFENSTDLGIKAETAVFESGDVICTPVGARHEIKCLSETGRTLHVYVPKISDHLTRKNLSPVSTEILLSEMNHRLEAQGVNWPTLLSAVEKIQSRSISTHSTFFMNQLFAGVLPEMLLAEEVIAKTKSTLATFEASPALSLIEMEVVKNLGKLIGWSEIETEGVTVPGGSAANFMAIHCARQRRFPDCKTKGLSTNVKMKIFVSEQAHYSFKKACAVLGFGTDAVVSVKVDERGRLLVADLQQQVERAKNNGDVPLLICATAGTTVFGAFDPIEEIANVCRASGSWLHVDAAWGGPVLFSKQFRHLMNGVELANSVTFDAHKLFGASLTCSFFMTRDPKILLEANDVSGAEYLFHEGSDTIDRGRLSWQCGRKADAMSFWTIWKSRGTNGLGALLEHLLDVKRESVEWIKTQPRLVLMMEPEFLNICVRVRPPLGSDSNPLTWSVSVREELRKRNLTMVNYSQSADGYEFLRVILAHPKMDFETVKTILTWALEIE